MQHETHEVSAQSPKRSRNANLPPPSFPLEIIVEILSNLPVKSLLRFRQDTVILLNPALRVSKRLPDLGFKKRRGCYTVYGFGFDASLDDYKVVRVFCYQSKGFEDAYESIVRVYSLRTNSWRRIQDFHFGVPCNEAAKHVDGNLNWIVFHGQEGFSCTIVSLDLAQETYKEVPQPCYGDGASERTLGVLDGCLCVLCNYGRLYAVVWVMKEYGKRESWTKLITIPYLPYPGAEFYSAPLFVSETGVILFHLGMNLVLYDSKENAFRIPVIPYDAISVSKGLPDLDCKTGTYPVYGFGFDASMDDYKIVRVCSHPDKAIEDGYDSTFIPRGLIVGEGFTISHPGRDVGFPFTIISLDLARETYDEVMQQCYGEGGCDGAGERTLGVLDGCREVGVNFYGAVT
ncbi:hypothetical protein F3Y22_tig00110602pilonHSYRG00089 [Hibiscus syriacus]|uniref:F-box associated beta-propeller type 1 domain-containing protein n=1 Tax=Hibiscus syriacus TaxID=106335 RepID=A0A6A3A365_HIBSY|nr:hypothetical protein F3Y22_tig00110602pilonHSYRG00089 [Hibiscus syriacus]